mmetsp:Transcript_12398/g.32753  ORF Transcript_12398/g.32753 Transcript_12398/m.32753 type:complete len:213 (-) Transcript_12398:70-708(-)
MMLPSLSKVWGLLAISEWSAAIFCLSSWFPVSASLAFRSRSRFRPASWALASRSLSSSSSSLESSSSGTARGSSFLSVFSLFLDDFSDCRERRLEPMLLVPPIFCLPDAAVPGTKSLCSTRLIGRYMRAQLSISPGAGSSSSSQSEPGSPSPGSCATKHMSISEAMAAETASAAKPKAFRSRYFCQRIMPPSVRIWSTMEAAFSSAQPWKRL